MAVSLSQPHTIVSFLPGALTTQLELEELVKLKLLHHTPRVRRMRNVEAIFQFAPN